MDGCDEGETRPGSDVTGRQPAISRVKHAPGTINFLVKSFAKLLYTTGNMDFINFFSVGITNLA